MRHHAHPRLGVAQHKVHGFWLFAFKRADLSGQGFDRRGDVHGLAFVRVDKVDGRGSIGFVLLHAVGQAHGNKAVRLIAGLLAQLLHGLLSQQACGQRVDAAADAQHQGLEPGVVQAALNKGDAPCNLGLKRGSVFKRRLDIEIFSNLTLYGLHDSLLGGLFRNIENVAQVGGEVWIRAMGLARLIRNLGDG